MADGKRFLIDLLFPPKCAACGTLLDFSKPKGMQTLCDKCHALWTEARRDRCGHCMCEVQDCACLTELLEKAGCEGFFKSVYYRHGSGNSVQNKLIFRIKNKRDYRTPRFLAADLADILQKRVQNGDLCLENAMIAYIPRRRSVVLETGTDQAKALAQALSKKLDVPVFRGIVRKKGGQREQKTLPVRERMKNARASFALKHPEQIAGKTVILVDDIVTTGASMAACLPKLRLAGALHIYCVAVSSDDGNQQPKAVLIKKNDIFSG